ncbi:hypothetical protein FB451DRAFT_1255009 [Mycena latifolia]|nr:hypothetical protein FB451DRAFT_1255009 [Mycena latifolia]
MAAHLAELPLDLVLQICLCLELADAIALLSTCTGVRHAMAEKTFWIEALNRVSFYRLHPIAGPICEDLTLLSLGELQEAGKRTNRLMKSWNSDHPMPESTQTIYVDAMSDIIVVPGTGLVIVHGPAFVACWDVHSMACVARLVLPRDIVIESASFEESGKVMLGAIATDSYDVFKVLAISVDYRDRAAISILEVYRVSPHLRRGFFKTSPVSVDHDTVRLTVSTASQPYVYSILSASFGGEHHNVRNVFPPTANNTARLRPVAVQSIPSPTGPPHFLRHMGSYGEIVHLGTRTRTAPPSTIPLGHDRIHISHHPVARPTGGVVHVTADADAVQFWTAEDGVLGRLFGPVTQYPVLGGLRTAVAGVSGVYVLLACKDVPLRLLRYTPAGEVVQRLLDVPRFMQGARLALDDHLGLIFGLHQDGTLRIMSYA